MLTEQVTPLDCGRRLKILRGMAQLTATELAERAKVGVRTIRYWEMGQGSGLTTSGAEKIVGAMHLSGVLCNSEWLLLGIGMKPQLLGKEVSGSDRGSKETLSEETKIEREIRLFEVHYPDAICMQVPDNQMSPLYEKNDYIGGVKVEPNDLDVCNQKNCIVETKEYGLMVRQVFISNKPGLINLIRMNNQNESPILTDVSPQIVAPIIYHRKPGS